MSVVTKEEIEHIVFKEKLNHEAPRWTNFTAFTTYCCERVAALVEERLREMVCRKCGETKCEHSNWWWCFDCNDFVPQSEVDSDGQESGYFHAKPGSECWGNCIKVNPTTRAQYEADREGR